MPYIIFEKGVKVGQYEEMPEKEMTVEELLDFHIRLNGGNKADMQVYEATEEELDELNRRGAYEFIDGKLIIKDAIPQSQPQPPSIEDRLKAVEDTLLSML